MRKGEIPTQGKNSNLDARGVEQYLHSQFQVLLHKVPSAHYMREMAETLEDILGKIITFLQKEHSVEN